MESGNISHGKMINDDVVNCPACDQSYSRLGYPAHLRTRKHGKLILNFHVIDDYIITLNLAKKQLIFNENNKRPLDETPENRKKCRIKPPSQQIIFPSDFQNSLPPEDPPKIELVNNHDFQSWLSDPEHQYDADIYVKNWQYIATWYRFREKNRIAEYNIRIPFNVNVETILEQTVKSVHEVRRDAAYWLNISASFILYNQENKQLRFFYQSCNTRFFQNGFKKIASQQDFDRILNKISNFSLREKIQYNRPNTKHVFHRLTNFTFLISTIKPNYMKGSFRVPEYLKYRKGLINPLITDDNLCFFRCLALAQQPLLRSRCNERLTKQLLIKFCTNRAVCINFKDFNGILPNQFKLLEKIFNINIYVYSLLPNIIEPSSLITNDEDDEDNEIDTSLEKQIIDEYEEMENAAIDCPLKALLIRRGENKDKNAKTIILNQTHSHYSLIKSFHHLDNLVKCFVCNDCEYVFDRRGSLIRHQTTCKGSKKFQPAKKYAYGGNLKLFSSHLIMFN